jgi:hypothetical protein
MSNATFNFSRILRSAYLFAAILGFSPIKEAARSKTWTDFAGSDNGIVSSNPTQGMDVSVRLFCVCVVLCVRSDLAMGWSPDQGVLPTVYMIKKLKKRTSPKKGLLSHNNNNNNSIQLFIIYVPSQQLQGQLQTQHSVDTSNNIIDEHNIKSKTN